MNKLLRQKRILALVRQHQIHTQEQLAELLKQSGIDSTQVTLSRDIRDLGLVKAADGYHAVEGTRLSGPPWQEMASESLVDVRTAQNLVVLTTHPGYANALASALDRASLPDIVGTIAGDDTIFVATPSPEHAARLSAMLIPYSA